MLTAQPLAALPPYGCGVPFTGGERLGQLRISVHPRRPHRLPNLSLRGPSGAVAISGRQLRFRRECPVIHPGPARLHPKGTSSRCALRAPRRAFALPAMTNLGAIAFLTLARTSRRCSVGRGMPLPYNARQKASCSSPHSIFNFPLPSRSVPTHNVINIFVLWKKHKNPRGNPKRSLIIPSRRDLTNAGKCDKIKAQRESGAFKNTDPVFGIARQDRFVADRLGTPAFAAGAPFFFRRGREENQNV